MKRIKPNRCNFVTLPPCHPVTLPLHRSICLLSLLLFWLLFLLPLPTYAQGPEARPAVSNGRANWPENCAPCHGPTGLGDGPTAAAIQGEMPNLAAPETARQMVPTTYFDVIKNGRMDKMMPPWGNRFDDQQIWDLTAYVWSLGTPPESITAGEAIYQEQCAACHGDDGAGDGPEAPAGLAVDFTDLPAMAQISQADLFQGYGQSEAHAGLRELEEAGLWQSLDYIRTFSLALPQRNGVLTGQVRNATTNEPAGQVDLTLRVFEGTNEIETLTTQADAGGNFTFDQLADDPALRYVLEGDYNGVTFRSQVLGQFTPGQAETTLDLNVYDTTTDPAGISLTQLHYVLAFTPETINVLQIFVVGNTGDQAYVGGDNGQTFAFSLPAGAENVAFQNDPNQTRFVETDEGYADTEPVIPGEEGASVIASYDVPYEGDTATLAIPLPADVASVNLLMADQGANLKSEQLQFIETRQFQGDTFAIFSGSDLKQGETLTLELSDLSALEASAGVATNPVATPPVDQTLLMWSVLGLGLIAIIGAGVIYPLVRPRLAPQAVGLESDVEVRRQRLLLTLARLDEVYAAGELAESVYRPARARYKAELARLMELG